MTFESTRSQIKPIDRSSGRLLYQPHSAVDEDHHANNGHARNSGKEQWIKHWTLHRHVFGLAPPGGHAKSETVSLHSNGNLQDHLGAASLTDSRRIKDPMSLMNLEVVLLTQFPGEIQVLRQQ